MLFYPNWCFGKLWFCGWYGSGRTSGTGNEVAMLECGSYSGHAQYAQFKLGGVAGQKYWHGISYGFA